MALEIYEFDNYRWHGFDIFHDTRYAPMLACSSWVLSDIKTHSVWSSSISSPYLLSGSENEAAALAWRRPQEKMAKTLP